MNNSRKRSALEEDHTFFNMNHLAAPMGIADALEGPCKNLL